MSAAMDESNTSLPDAPPTNQEDSSSVAVQDLETTLGSMSLEEPVPADDWIIPDQQEQTDGGEAEWQRVCTCNWANCDSDEVFTTEVALLDHLRMMHAEDIITQFDQNSRCLERVMALVEYLEEINAIVVRVEGQRSFL